MQISIQTMVVAAGLSLVFGIVLAWRGRRYRDRLDRFDERLAQLTASLSLLTDTTETGLRDVATEMARMAATTQAAAPRPRAVLQRRMAGAVRHGRSIQEIAAEEHVSEGEVRLRLELEKARKETHATVC